MNRNKKTRFSQFFFRGSKERNAPLLTCAIWLAEDREMGSRWRQITGTNQEGNEVSSFQAWSSAFERENIGGMWPFEEWAFVLCSFVKHRSGMMSWHKSTDFQCTLGNTCVIVYYFSQKKKQNKTKRSEAAIHWPKTIDLNSETPFVFAGTLEASRRRWRCASCVTEVRTPTSLRRAAAATTPATDVSGRNSTSTPPPRRERDTQHKCECFSFEPAEIFGPVIHSVGPSLGQTFPPQHPSSHSSKGSFLPSSNVVWAIN